MQELSTVFNGYLISIICKPYFYDEIESTENVAKINLKNNEICPRNPFIVKQ